MNPNDYELMQSYMDLIDEFSTVDIAGIPYKPHMVWQSYDPDAFMKGWKEYLRLKKEEGIELEDWDDTAPPEEFEFNPEWQSVNKSWKIILKRKGSE